MSNIRVTGPLPKLQGCYVFVSVTRDTGPLSATITRVTRPLSVAVMVTHGRLKGLNCKQLRCPAILVLISVPIDKMFRSTVLVV